MSKVLAKTVHLHVGAPVLGGRLSVQAGPNATLEVKPEGVYAYRSEGKNKPPRSVLIPYSNITCMELYTEQELAKIAAVDRARTEADARRKAAQAATQPEAKPVA